MDAIPLLNATRLGYEIISDNQDCNWYRKDGQMKGPFKTLEDASYAAISDYETQLAFAMLDQHERSLL
jgi:hypothetical protein